MFHSASPAARAQKDTEIEDRRVRVARYHLQRKTQSEIASLLGVSQSTVHNDIVAIKEAWQKEYSDDYMTLVARELAALDQEQHLLEDERDTLLAGQRSNANLELILSVTDRIDRIGQHRRKILGVGTVAKVAFTDPSGQEGAFTDDYRNVLIEKAYRELQKQKGNDAEHNGEE